MDGYQEEGLTYADLNPQTIYLTDGLRCRKTDSGYVLEAMGSDEEWHAITGGGGGESTLELTSTGDNTDQTTFTADNSGIKQVDVNNVEMLRVWTDGTFGGDILIVDKIPDGFIGNSSDTVFIGTQIAPDCVGSSANVAIGNSALGGLTTGAQNVGVGIGTGSGVSEGEGNTFIGTSAGANGDVNESFAIGLGAKVSADNTGVIGNESTTDVIFGASDTTQTSGALVVGKQYRIISYQAGDDFTNVGASANETGEVFTATGTTPTTWTNSSALVQLYPDGLAIMHGKGDAIVFPDSDPHVDGAAYWDSGVLVRSNG